MALTDNLISYYKLDESSGNAADATGNGYNATNNGTVTYSAGKINNGANFSGSNYFSTPSLPIGSGHSTINIWVKVSALPATLFALVGGAKGYPGLVMTPTGFSVGKIGTSPGSNVEFSVSLNTYYMVTVNFTSSTTVDIYVNKDYIGTSTEVNAYTLGNHSLNIGTGFDLTDIPFVGQLDEISVFARDLTGSEMNTLYSDGAGNQYPWAINYIRALSDSISYSASRSITLTRLGTFARNLSGSILNSASRFVILTKGQIRTLSDSIMNGASRFTSLTKFISYMRGLSDSIMNSVSRFTTIIRFIPFVRNLSDSIMNAKNRLATVSRGIIHFIRNLSDSIMNGALRFVTLKTINPFHSVWKLVIKATTSWKSTTKSKTNWNKKITGQ